MKRIFAHANQPGSANALVPHILALRDLEEMTLEVFSAPSAQPVFHSHGIETQLAPEQVPKEGWDAWLAGCDLLLTGTSFPPDLENALWSCARRRDVPTVAVLDQWMDYALRFQRDGNIKTAALPDLIAVIDEVAVREMVALGFPESRLFIAGLPYLEDIAPLPDREPPLKLARELRVLFASEPTHLSSGHGYTEHEALATLLGALRKVLPDREVAVLCKLHPRHEPEAEARAKACARPFLSPGLRLEVCREGRSRNLIAASDLVAGMSSMMLLEAARMNVPVVSIQPHLQGADPCYLSRVGLIKTAVSEALLVEELRAALGGRKIRFELSARGRHDLAAWIIASLGLKCPA